MVKVKKGFSLIELIIVIGLISLLMLGLSSTLLMSIISSNRIRTVTKTKQAGNYALGQIQSMIRNARSLDCTDAPTSITIQNLDGGLTLFSLSIGRLASGSAYLTPENIAASNLSLICEPINVPTLVTVAFDLKDSILTKRATENPLLHFETSINLRNQ